MAVRIDAAADRLVRTSGVLDMNSAYTWMGWLYFVSLPTTRYSTPWLIQTNAGGANSSDYLQVNSSATHVLDWGCSLSNAFHSRVGTTTISTATWYHLALVRTSLTSLQGYVNGVAEGAAITNDMTARGAATRMEMGAYDAGGTDWMDGRIAYATIWNRALTAAEILNQMRAVRPLFFTGSVWSFTPLWPNQRTKDLSGNGRDWTEAGTLTDEDPPPVSYGGPSWVIIAAAAAGPTTAYRDTGARFKLEAAATRDTSARFKLQALSYRDSTARLRLRADAWRLTSGRLRLASEATYRFTSARLKLLAQAYRDTSARFRLAATNTRDTAGRLLLRATGYRDSAARFRLQSLNDAIRDSAARFRLADLSYRNTTSRLKLAAAAVRDSVARFRVAALVYRDSTGRLRLAAGGGGYIAAVIADNPISYWRLGEASGTVALDQMGVRNGAYDLTGVTEGVPGALVDDTNTAAAFDGSTNASIPLADVAAHNITGDITFEAWIKTNSINGYIFGAHQFVTAGYSLFLSSGALRWRVGALLATAGPIVSLGVWHHVVVTGSGSSGTYYVDGVPKSFTYTAPTSYSGQRAIGADPSLGTNFDGQIDEVALYGTALSQPRVMAHYRAGTTYALLRHTIARFRLATLSLRDSVARFRLLAVSTRDTTGRFRLSITAADLGPVVVSDRLIAVASLSDRATGLATLSERATGVASVSDRVPGG